MAAVTNFFSCLFPKPDHYGQLKKDDDLSNDDEVPDLRETINKVLETVTVDKMRQASESVVNALIQTRIDDHNYSEVETNIIDFVRRYPLIHRTLQKQLRAIPLKYECSHFNALRKAVSGWKSNSA